MIPLPLPWKRRWVRLGGDSEILRDFILKSEDSAEAYLARAAEEDDPNLDAVSLALRIRGIGARYRDLNRVAR